MERSSHTFCLLSIHGFSDTNYHIGNHRFRVLADGHKGSYQAASRKDKAIVVLEVVQCWRAKNPPGRFLTRTNPELGDDTLWHDVGEEAALKKAAKILSEKTPSHSKKGEGQRQKRRAVESPERPPAKEPNTGTRTPAIAPVVAAAVPVSGAGFSGAASSIPPVHRGPQAPLWMPHLPPQPASLNPYLLQLLMGGLPSEALRSLSSNLSVRNLYGLNNANAGPTPSQTALQAALAARHGAESSAASQATELAALARASGTGLLDSSTATRAALQAALSNNTSPATYQAVLLAALTNTNGRGPAAGTDSSRTAGLLAQAALSANREQYAVQQRLRNDLIMASAQDRLASASAQTLQEQLLAHARAQLLAHSPGHIMDINAAAHRYPRRDPDGERKSP